ncbi:MAG TPA: hypothetical protein ENF81_01540 [Thermotogaceae bacterium]|nr:hypothetical protein [Thermotogaceae bacterium]
MELIESLLEEPRRTRITTPDRKMWFFALANAIDIYLCGIDCFKERMYKSQEWLEVERWIFHGNKNSKNSFDSLWEIFYPEWEIKHTKKKLREALDKRLALHKIPKKGKRNGKGNNSHARRKAAPGSNNDNEGSLGYSWKDAWLQSVIF